MDNVKLARNLVKEKIEPLKHPQIKDELQTKYLQILIDFEKNN